MVWGESGARGKERGFVLIIHPNPLTDRSRHAALWMSAPAYRKGEERRSERNSGSIVEGREGEKKLMPARHPILGGFWWFSQRDFYCSKHCFISWFVCASTCVM